MYWLPHILWLTLSLYAVIGWHGDRLEAERLRAQVSTYEDTVGRFIVATNQHYRALRQARQHRQRELMATRDLLQAARLDVRIERARRWSWAVGIAIRGAERYGVSPGEYMAGAENE